MVGYQSTTVTYERGERFAGESKYPLGKMVAFALEMCIRDSYKNMPFLQLLINLPLILSGILIKSLFFLKKGFAGEYLRGIGAGITGCRECKKVRFSWKNLGNYAVIPVSYTHLKQPSMSPGGHCASPAEAL